MSPTDDEHQGAAGPQRSGRLPRQAQSPCPEGSVGGVREVPARLAARHGLGAAAAPDRVAR